MKKSLYILFLFFFLTVNSVDRNNFKTCNQSGFCKRQRNYVAGSDECEIDSESIVIQKSQVIATVFCKNKDKKKLVLTKLKGHMFRLHISEVEPQRKRFEPEIGEVLIEDPVQEEMFVSHDKHENRLLIKGLLNEKGILYLNPFKLDLYLDDTPLISVNSRNLFKFEHYKKEKTDEENKNEHDNSLIDEEPFKGHKDSHPFGAISVGMDVSFPGYRYVYGIPEHADKFALRNTQDTDPYRLYNLDVFEYEINNPMALYGSVPLLWAHNKNHTSGMLWNNPTETWIDIHSSLESLSTFSKILNFVKSTDVKTSVDTHWMSEAGVIDLFLFMGDSPTEVFRYYSQLTGSTPLPPLFSIAYHQSRWNYNDQRDVESVDKQFDEGDIPYDVIWLDIEHTDDKRYFTWDKTKFPEPDKMVDMLDVKSRKLVTVIDPHIKRSSGWNLYESASSNNYFIKKSDGVSTYEGWCWPGSSSWPDFNDAAVRTWWAQQFLTYEGSRANNTYSWNDMGEPSVFSGPEVTMEKDCVHLNGHEHREVHNLYGLQIHRATWNGQLLRSNNEERPFVLTRAFFAGSQRYSSVWTGDNTANWEHLQITTPMLLSMSVAGIHFCGADVGGFFGNPDQELLARWYQAASWHPFFRAHAHLDTKRREPYLLEGEYKETVRFAIKERYRMLPYWYTQFRHSELTGDPVMAPLWQHFPQDEITFPMDDQFMVGPAILVKPVVKSGQTQESVYLPEGLWYLQSAWTQYYGGSIHHNIPVAGSASPVFYRGGHIVPRRERTRRASLLSRLDPLTFLVLLDKQQNAHGNLYLDDYHTFDYINNQNFRQVNISFVDFTLTSVDINSLHIKNPHIPELNPIVERIVICGLKDKPEKINYVDYNKKVHELEFFYMAERLLLVIRNPRAIIGKQWSVQLQYKKFEL